MCEFHKPKPKFIPDTPVPTKRKKLWQIDSSFYCAILGTCLTIGDLRRVARQCQMPLEQGITDYDLHRRFVAAASSHGHPSKLLNKLLDKRYATTVKRINSCRESAEFQKHWKQALVSGEIPAMFWAFTTHPHIKKELLEEVYGDVHMLSHLQGSSNRADIRRINSLEQQLEEAKQRLVESHTQFSKQLKQKDLRIYELEQEILKRLNYQPEPQKEVDNELEEAERQRDKYARHADWVEQRLAQRDIILNQAQQSIAALKELLEENESERRSMEATVSQLLQMGKSDKQVINSNLAGKSIAYVGGRQSLSNHLRDLVERYQGRFSHHDGGQEESRANITCSLSGADMVFCPIDCVSHDACLRVKRYCKQNDKPFIPLRSSGLSAFTKGLNQYLEQESYQ